MLKRGTLYKIAKYWGDFSAIKSGKPGKRVGRRLAGRYTGKKMGSIFGP